MVGPRGERKGADAIPGVDVSVGQDDVVKLGSIEAKVLDVPGHTAGHVAYHFAGDAKVFVGDTLFAMGCGRLFEGDAATMWNSIQKIIALPETTAVYCAHEYTLTNARFAVDRGPGKRGARAPAAGDGARARRAGRPPSPRPWSRELETNPFCRPKSEGLTRGARDGGRDGRGGVRGDTKAQGRVLMRRRGSEKHLSCVVATTLHLRRRLRAAFLLLKKT